MLPPSVSARLVRWSAASRNSATQRFKKDSFIKYRNCLKLPKFCKPLSSLRCKKAIWVTLKFFLASISANFKLIFLYFGFENEWNSCQIHFPHEKSVQMSYWRSQLNNFEDFWPKSSILCFEIWIISRLSKTFLVKMTYHRLLCSTNNISQAKFCSIFH